jgi:hypothetical protein
MRQLLRELAACALLLAALGAPAMAQQGGVQVTAAAHSLHGDSARLAQQTLFEPDLGIIWLSPGAELGTFQLELRAITRDGRPNVGRAFVSLRDFTYRGVKYTIEAGDSVFSPAPGEYQLRNLYTPSVHFAGLGLKARTDKWNGAVMVGRGTATRNIFGTDTELLDQDLAIARGTFVVSDRLEISARLARIRTEDLKEFRYSIADSSQAGGGMKFVLTPFIHLAADASAVRFRRRGETTEEQDVSALAGATFLLSRGWFQVNASRFSPGELPILTQPLADRRTAHAAGEYDVIGRVRLFGGLETFETNLYESAIAQAPPGRGNRGFAGMRVPLGSRSSAAIRIEEGDRRSRLVGASLIRVSDTGVLSSEWQTVLGPFSGFTRYARRTNVESETLIGSYTQHDGSGLVFVNLTRHTQLFGSITGIHNVNEAGSGHTFWQFGGGTQTQVLKRGLWMRAEGLASRNIDLVTDRPLPQHTFNFGLNGEFLRNTTIGLNIYADRLPHGATGASGDSWIARSSVRVTRSFPTSSPRAGSAIGSAMARHGGTGSLGGMVYSDWNSNGVQDPEDQPLENIPVRLMNLGHATTSRAGEFAFINVPIGMQQVGIDLSSLPVDFDPPPVPQVQLSLGRGETKRLAFGLVPLGTVAGRVVRDANGNGTADAGDQPIDGPIVVLNAGARSEQARRGQFRFDAVRSGEHTLELLAESLPPGSEILGDPRVKVAIGREALVSETTFVVNVGERPEIRRVFAGRDSSTSTAPATPRPATRAPATATGRPAATPPHAAVGRQPPPQPAPGQYSIQVGAFRRRSRGVALVQSLKNAGFAAYLVVPTPADPLAPYKVRVGSYDTAPDAESDVQALEARLKQKVWLVAVNPPR